MRGGNGSQWKVIADWLWGESNKGLWKARNKRKVFSSLQATGSKGNVNSSTKSCAALSWFLLPCSCKLSLLKILIQIFNNLDRGQDRQVKRSPAIHSSSGSVDHGSWDSIFPHMHKAIIIRETNLQPDDFTAGKGFWAGTAHLWLRAGAWKYSEFGVTWGSKFQIKSVNFFLKVTYSP